MFKTRTSQIVAQDWEFYGVTIGTVVDTNDPQQMGRVRAQCIALNDPKNGDVDQVPWAMYAAPFAGTVQRGTRGDENTEVSGPVAYGMWAIPKVGSQVLVMCLDGNPQTRVWVGCLHTELAPHTMPHGRFSY
ncbi:MAG: phage baseplate assembly protein V, partial [Candidatus Kariarchaeaceae archaeon]